MTLFKFFYKTSLFSVRRGAFSELELPESESTNTWVIHILAPTWFS
ncbi:hypothetical protein VIDI103191_20850 [Vibrio diazotrophicus]